MNAPTAFTAVACLLFAAAVLGLMCCNQPHHSDKGDDFDSHGSE